jgi:hypothetical protein
LSAVEMKTWIFSEDTLNRAIDQWVEEQIALNHPKATENNVQFVASAVRDLLDNPKLFKKDKTLEEELKTTGFSPSVTVENLVKTVENQQSGQSDSDDAPLNVDDMLKEWRKM